MDQAMIFMKALEPGGRPLFGAGSLLAAVAMFVFLPAAAGTGFVPPNLWRGPHHCAGNHAPVFIEPFVVFLFEPRGLVVDFL
jgi:uncharacterized protein involved in response to NO